MKKYQILFLLMSILTISSCSKGFLDYTPKGKVSDEQLNTAANVDGMCIAAYAALGNDDFTVPYVHTWAWGSVRGGDAYKGGGSVGDQGYIDNLEKFNLVTVDIASLNTMWIALYEGIARTNDAIQRMNKLSATEYPKKSIRLAEMRYIRGHFHFLLKVLFKNIPYIDDVVLQKDRGKIDNSTLTDIQLWEKIEADFQFGVDNLPVAQAEVGRANKMSASAYLAKVNLYKAYQQDKNNQVTSVNAAALAKVIAACDAVINSGKYSLESDFGNNWLYPLSENNKESVFAVQYSINDGTPNGRINMSSSLNYNMASTYGCCSFHAPSQNLVNAFKTDANGLPLPDTYNDVSMKDSVDYRTNGIDPRLDHTVGVPTHPFKYIPTFIAQKTWQRVPSIYGQFTPMKEIAQYTSPAFKKVGAFFGSATNWNLIKYDEVLLWKAEALIELGREAEALPIINLVRARAAASTGMLKYADGRLVANYRVSPYVDGTNITWSNANARKALRFERRLEFAMEGQYFFDLVRWGIASEKINQYFTIEKTRVANLASAKFTSGRDEYLPIPINQITLTLGLLKQNPNW
jgi:hypothetical protein